MSGASKPLNPFASSYEFQNLSEIYGPEWIHDVDRRKGKRRSVPPRLRLARKKFPVQIKKVWLQKADAEKMKAASDHVTAEEKTKFYGKTSLMIKNVPNQFQRFDLQGVLDDHCRNENRKAQPGSQSAYDFLYLPMDFRFHMNLGYAFVNFTSPIAALRFYNAFNNRKWSYGGGRKKLCEIRTAKHQGRDALKERFEQSVFPCGTDEYLPVVYRPARDGFNRSSPIVVGRRSHQKDGATNGERMMIMTRRKNKKQV